MSIEAGPLREPGAIRRSWRARISAAELGAWIDALRVDGGPLPFAAGSFDVVFSKDSLVQIPGKAALFAEGRRVLRPGERFLASNWLRGGTGPYSAYP